MTGRIICGDARTAIPEDILVQLVVTSPPYNVGMRYDEHDDQLTPDQYIELLEAVLGEAWDRMEPGGRMCVNTHHDSGRSPAYPTGMVTQMVLEQLPGSLNRGAIVWDKGAQAGPRTSWGTWMSPKNPVLRGEYEMIFVYSKGSLELGWRTDGPSEPDIGKDEFLIASKDVWRDVPTVTQKFSSHPAAFSHVLARRLIQFYSWPGDMVLDPFLGSGTTGLAAARLGRDWVGVDISEEYCALAAERTAMFPGMEPEVEFVD